MFRVGGDAGFSDSPGHGHGEKRLDVSESPRILANLWVREVGRQRKLVPDCAPALRHSAIIFHTRTQGRCNQH